MLQYLSSLIASVFFILGMHSIAEKIDPVLKKTENFESARPGNLDFPGNAAFPD